MTKQKMIPILVWDEDILKVGMKVSFKFKGYLPRDYAVIRSIKLDVLVIEVPEDEFQQQFVIYSTDSESWDVKIEDGSVE